MDVKTVLSELGLSDGEIKVYLALLKLGSSPVSHIKEESGLHRTTIYDFVEKLLNKGLISYVVRNNVKYYNAANPNKLVDYLKEKHDNLSKVLPELVDLTKDHQEEVKVEVYKGKEGLKTVMLDCIRLGEDTCGIGIDDSLYKKTLPVFIEQFQRMLKEKNMHERILTKANPDYLFDQSNTHYKFLPSDYFSPTSTLVYGNKLHMVVWEPSLTTILIQNKQLVDAYRKHFENMWNQETMIFAGDDDVRGVFDDMVENTQKGDEILAFGVPNIPPKWVDYFDDYCVRLGNKGVINKIIVDEKAKPLIDMNLKHDKVVRLRVLPSKFFSPAEVDIWGGKVAITLWSKVPKAIVMDDRQIADSFRQYFNIMWEMAKKPIP